MSRVAIVNNLFDQVGTDAVLGAGPQFVMVRDMRDITLAYNTVTTPANHFILMDELPGQTRLSIVANVAHHGVYGLFGSDAGGGLSALARYAPTATVRGNIIAGAAVREYPPDNFYPTRFSDLPFNSPGTGDHSLGPSSGYLFMGVPIGVRNGDLAAARAAALGN
jgi:hypothetical protein